MFTVFLAASGLWNSAALAQFPDALRNQGPEIRIVGVLEKRILTRRKLVAGAMEGKERDAEFEALRQREAVVAKVRAEVAAKLAAPWTRIFQVIGGG